MVVYCIKGFREVKGYCNWNLFWSRLEKSLSINSSVAVSVECSSWKPYWWLKKMLFFVR
jgi:hypothetical protein